MSQIHDLMKTLKKVLRSQKITYRDVAEALGLSEASIKRLFAGENLSMVRLEQICNLAGLEISDLVEEMEVGDHRIRQLSEDQEREIVSDSTMLLMTLLVVNRWRLGEILAHYRLSEAEVIRCLTRMDKLRLIDLLPGNHIKLLISPNFTWRHRGPIQRYFITHVQRDFLRGPFDRQGEAFMFLSGMLSRASGALLAEKLQRLANEFNELNRQDRHLPIPQRMGYSMIMAVRPWHPKVFNALKR